MRNALILLLTVAIVAAGALLPGIALERASEPDLPLDYPLPEISSETNSAYPWRMARIGERYYSENSTLLRTFISREDYTAAEEGEEQENLEGVAVRDQFLGEFTAMTQQGIFPASMLNALRGLPTLSVSYYYLFDSADAGGFRIAELHAVDGSWEFTATMDLESGKIGRIYSVGGQWGDQFRNNADSWYDILRRYADYLGMSSAAFQVPETGEQNSVSSYYDKITLDRIAAQLTASPGDWLEVRALQEKSNFTLCVFRGGK